MVHPDRVERARTGAPPAAVVSRAAALLGLLGDPTRIRIISALEAEELCVCDLAAVAGASESATSHSLRLLRHAGLVSRRGDGKMAYYRLADEHPAQLVRAALDHASHAPATLDLTGASAARRDTGRRPVRRTPARPLP